MRPSLSVASLLLSALATLAAHAQTTPVGVTLLASDGNLYGVDGPDNYTFFSYSPTTLQTTVLNSATSGLQLCLERSDGTLLGINSSSANKQFVKVSLAGVITPIAQFPGANDLPVCPAIANDGNYYGASTSGGEYGYGYLYQLTAAGVLTDFYNFADKNDGSAPGALPVQGSDGNLYFADDNKLLRYNETTGLAVLPLADNLGNQTLLNANPSLLEASDGNFYAISADSAGAAIARVTPEGVTTIIYNSTDTDDIAYYPFGGLYLTGGTQLAVLQPYGYAQDDINGCEETGNTYSMVPLSLTGTAGNTLLTIGTYEENASISNYPYLFLGGNGTFYGSYYYEGFYSSGPENCDGGSLSGDEEYLGTTTLTPPIQMTLNKTHVVSGGSATLTWKVNNAYSDTMQQCYGFGGLSGKLALSGTATVTAPAAGTYTGAIVCGGTETGLATLTAGPAAIQLNVPYEVTVGSPATLTATVTNPGTPLPTGKVTFLSGTEVIGTATLSNNVATLTASTAGLHPGSYSVVASYAGDANYNAATSLTDTVQLVAPSATQVVVTPSTQTLVAGSSASFVATVTGSSVFGQPTGTVKFLSGSTVLATETLATGSTSSTASLSQSTLGVASGTYSVVASYGGDANNLASTSTPVTVIVQTQTSLSLTATPNPLPANDSLVLTVTAKGSVTPTGTVFFYAGTDELASASLNGSGVGTVTLPKGTLSAGTYSMTAYYVGDKNNPSGTSPAVPLTVQ